MKQYRLFLTGLCTALIFLLVGNPLFAHSGDDVRKSSISITGKTNVNSFEFHQSMTMLSFDASPLGKSLVRIAIPVRQFETDNSLMYNDFLKLLKSNEYPFIYIDLLRSDFIAIQQGRTVFQSIRFYLTIAGTTKHFTIPSKIEALADQCFNINGKSAVVLPDFKITPPERFLGMVKVHDQVEIKFNFAVCSNVVALKDDKK